MPLTWEDHLTYNHFRFRALIDLRRRFFPLFITFEGIEGSGKTTQIRRLARYLAQKGISCTVTREPGGTRISEKIRKILLHTDHREMAPLTELLLYEAARAQHYDEVIKPILEKGGIVLCDRFSDATVAYQGFGRKLDLKLIDQLNRIATEGRRPDITFLLDCPLGLGLRRAVQRNRRQRKTKEERFERERIEFHHRVRKGYRWIARQEPHRVKVIDTREGPRKSFEKIQQIVDKLLLAKAKARGA